MGGVFYIKDPVFYLDPDGDWVLNGVMIIMLHYCCIMIVVLLVDEGDRDGVSGVEGGSYVDEYISLLEDDILDGDNLYSSRAGCL